MVKKGGRMGMFLNAATVGGGAILGISIITFIQAIIGLVIGYYIVMHARKLKKQDPDSSYANILELIGILIMFGPFAAFLTFVND